MNKPAYKQRVNFQVGKSIDLNDDEVGSYMMFYLIGTNVKQIVEQVVATTSNGTFNMQCATELRKQGIHIVVKAGTTANRKSIHTVDPFNQRGREILNELGRCFQGVIEGADVATRSAYEILASSDTYECHVVMVAHRIHSKLEYSTDIEQDISEHVMKTYGIEVANKATKFNKQREISRWGNKHMAIAF